MRAQAACGVGDRPPGLSPSPISAIITGGTYLAPSVPLGEGSNVLTVTATDPSGNSASAAVTITFDAIAPAVFEEVHAHLEAVALVAGALAATEASLSWCAGTPLCTTFVR